LGWGQKEKVMSMDFAKYNNAKQQLLCVAFSFAPTGAEQQAFSNWVVAMEMAHVDNMAIIQRLCLAIYDGLTRDTWPPLNVIVCNFDEPFVDHGMSDQ
jgi:hypothetical protein